MLTEVERAELDTESGNRVVASGALWLFPQDVNDARTWTESHFGAWDTLFRDIPQARWYGLLDVAYESGQVVVRESAARGATATLRLPGWSGRVLVQSTNVSRRPAVFGQAKFGEPRFGDSVGSWLLRVVGTSEAPPALSAGVADPRDGGRASDDTAPTASDGDIPLSREDRALLSKWSTQLAAGDPKAFATVVRDVITRMNRISDSDAPLTVRLHASAAARSLEIVRAGVTGDIPAPDARAAKESLAILVARLAALGIVAKYPPLGLLVRAAELILNHALQGSSGGTAETSPYQEPELEPRPNRAPRVRLTVEPGPGGVPRQGIAPITLTVRSSDGVPLPREKVTATIFGGRFEESRDGRWHPSGSTWAGLTDGSGFVMVNVSAHRETQTVTIEFEAGGVRLDHVLPVA